MKTAALLALAVAALSGVAHAALPPPVARAFRMAGVPPAPSRSSCRKRGKPQPMLAHEAAKPMNPGLGDEARHDVRRARAPGARLPVDDAGVPRRPARERRAARQSRAQGPWRPEDHDRAVAGVHGEAGRAGPHRRRRRPRPRPLVLRAGRRTTPPRSTASRSSPTTSDPTRCSSISRRSSSPSLRMPSATARGHRRSAARRTSRSARCRGSTPATATIGGARWARRSSTAERAPTPRSAAAIRSSCGEREWWVSLLDHPSYVHAMFTTYFRDAGGRFVGGWKDGRPRRASARSPTSSHRRSTTSCAT